MQCLKNHFWGELYLLTGTVAALERRTNSFSFSCKCRERYYFSLKQKCDTCCGNKIYLKARMLFGRLWKPIIESASHCDVGVVIAILTQWFDNLLRREVWRRFPFPPTLVAVPLSRKPNLVTFPLNFSFVKLRSTKTNMFNFNEETSKACQLYT